MSKTIEQFLKAAAHIRNYSVIVAETAPSLVQIQFVWLLSNWWLGIMVEKWRNLYPQQGYLHSLFPIPRYSLWCLGWTKSSSARTLYWQMVGCLQSVGRWWRPQQHGRTAPQWSSARANSSWLHCGIYIMNTGHTISAIQAMCLGLRMAT